MAVNFKKKTVSEKLITSETQNKIPFSIIESYKNIRTNLISVLTKTNGQILAVSSPNASEGKSTTAVNIAITLSQLNKKILILDADSRRPTVHKKMKLDNSKGCMNVLSGEAEVQEVIQHYNAFLDVIPAGTKQKNPSELFSSENFVNLLEELKQNYDYVILDTPPINPVSDALVISQKCDALVLVIRAGVTTYDAFEKAYESLKVLDVTLDGVIINGSDMRPKYYYKGKYNYYRYSNGYYGRNDRHY